MDGRQWLTLLILFACVDIKRMSLYQCSIRPMDPKKVKLASQLPPATKGSLLGAHTGKIAVG